MFTHFIASLSIASSLFSLGLPFNDSKPEEPVLRVVYPMGDNEDYAVNQGDRVKASTTGDDGVFCTVGYVDYDAGTMITSGHCAQSLGTKFYTEDDEYIGEAVEIHQSEDSGAPHWSDSAVIKLNDKFYPGKNHYSSDTWVEPSQVNVGDELCSYGSTTKKVRCGHVVRRDGNRIVGDRETMGRPGDSGGPTWIPGRGLVGIYNVRTPEETFSYYPDVNYKETAMDSWKNKMRTQSHNMKQDALSVLDFKKEK